MNDLLTQIYGYLHGMWRYRWSALLIAWLVALLGWLFVFSLPNQYTAKAVVYIDTTSVMKPLLKGLALETDTFDELAVMSRVLLSRDNLLSVIRETDMDLKVNSPEAREALAQELARSVYIQSGGGRGPKSNIYEIGYQCDSAERAYKVVSSLLNNMIENTLNSTRTDTVAAQKFLDTQIAEFEERLSIDEQKLAAFKKANIGYMPDEKGSYYSRLRRAQDEMEKVRLKLLFAKRRYSELQKQLRGEKPMLDSESYQTNSEAKLRQYTEQLNTLLSQYTEKHPDVQALKSRIADLKAGRAIAGDEDTSKSVKDEVEFNPVYQEIKVDLSKASVDVETLKIELDEKENAVQKLKDSIDIIPEVEAKLANLNRDYEITHKRYLSLVDRRESARLTQSAEESTSGETFRVIEPPRVPSEPSGPQRLLLLVGALAVALGAGLGWSLLRYLLQPTFINLQQLGHTVGLPVLGAVSLYLSPQHKRQRALQLASFLIAAVLLFSVFGGLLWYHDLGTAIIGSLISGII